MAIICPTITAYDPHEYRSQMEQVEAFAERIHIDLMDGEFAPTKSPDVDQVWWTDNLTADIHLMYKRPGEVLEQLVKLRPNLVVIHYEADVNHTRFSDQLREAGIKAGLAILQDTPVDDVSQILGKFDHVLVFSGHLGFHGGELEPKHLEKVRSLKELRPKIEIGWDGGINSENAKVLVRAGVDVLNTGGFIQKSSDPEVAYKKISAAIK